MKKIIIILLVVFSLGSCVSKSIYEDLENKYNRLKNQNKNLVGENGDLYSSTKDLENENTTLKSSMDSLILAKSILQNDVIALSDRKKRLENSYNELSKSSASKLDAKAKEILELSKQLDDKETALILESTRLEKLKRELNARSERIVQLETLIADKEQKMQDLKTAVSKALRHFEGKGLTVHRKQGKLYVSMENKLLFSSGSWSVGAQGKQAVIELAKVLKQNANIEVLIEGHTDNVPYKGNNFILDNWDLSTKRATAIVRILTDNKVSPKRISASGRSEFGPINSNTTKEGKAKNRRIEVILTPNLDDLTSLLER